MAQRNQQHLALKPPAEEVVDGPYEMRSLVAPVLTGWPLRAFLALMEGPLGALVLPNLARNSGMPQVLQEMRFPEEPLFSGVPPLWPEPEPLVDVLGTDATADTKVKAAAACLPGPADGYSGKLAAEGSSSSDYRPTAADYHAAYMSGSTTPSKVAERIITFMQQHEPTTHWFVSWSAAAIREQAAASADRYAAKQPLSVLDGVPFAVKDCIDALPHETTAGSMVYASMRPVTKDSPPVAALKSLGAVCLGKTAMQEFGLHPYGLNAGQGVAGNPHDLNRFAGGSSTGSAAVVAAGLCPFAFGTDGGGSIRIPAALCGVVGLKPTNGRMTRDGGVPVDNTVATSGPIAGSVADALLFYAATANVGASFAGNTPPPPLALPKQLLAAGMRPLEGVTMGVYRPWFNDAQLEVVAACQAALSRLEALGATIHSDLVLPELEELRVAHVGTIVSEIHATFAWMLKDRTLKQGLSLDTRGSFAPARFFEAREYVNAQRVRRRASIHFERAFKRVDIILTPSVPIVAPVIPPGARTSGMLNLPLSGQLIRFCQPANFLGHPGISVPVGVDSQLLPIGLQLMGRPWHEATLLRAAAALEADLANKPAAAAAAAAAEAGGGSSGRCPVPPLHLNPLAAA